jgi:hypothetical protein
MKARLLVALLALLAAAPAQAATKQRHYAPWASDGNPKIKRYIHGSGDCTQASLVNPRTDAWRCVSGTVTLDPCFQSPTDEEVLCASSPWVRRGYLLSALLEPDLGSSPAPGPWALQVGRKRCTYVPRRAGRRGGPTYRCGRSRRGPFLFGRPNKRRKTWTIRLARNKKGRGARRLPVRVAWS